VRPRPGSSSFVDGVRPGASPGQARRQAHRDRHRRGGLLLDTPIRFRTTPGEVRVRIPHHSPGYSPAAAVPTSGWSTITALLQTAAGRPVTIDMSPPRPSVRVGARCRRGPRARVVQPGRPPA
jgi:hypothetical protein